MNNIRRKVLLLIIAFFCFFFILAYIVINKKTYDAEYIYDINENCIGIMYDGESYYKGDYEMYPYYLVYDEIRQDEEKIYIEDRKKRLFTNDYFSFYCKSYDDERFFIVEAPYDSSLQILYIKNGFVYPNLINNKIDEVWMSLSSTDDDNIKDKETVSKIVECAKSEGVIELDQEIVDYIKKYSWDNHCFYLKYKGYPLVEEFHIEETEDGRYVVDQFTAVEYDTIYYDEVAHK